jgi:tetratricopeptide (TPR) repeat protein
MFVTKHRTAKSARHPEKRGVKDVAVANRGPVAHRKTSGSAPTPPGAHPRRTIAILIGVILIAGLSCYSNSLNGDFLFDDMESIPLNEHIRTLDPLELLNPPTGLTVSGRPLLNLTLAVNYALGGYDVVGYHLANILIHLCVAVVLFALVRGTLLRPGVPARIQLAATGIAFAVGLLWVVHPLNTEVVSYVVQRGEGLAALFLLLTLYSLLRGAEWGEQAQRLAAPAAQDPALIGPYQQAAARSSRNDFLAVVWCLLGMMSKESVAAAPVLALLYDRAFLSGSFAEALRRRRWVYVGLASTWLVLAYLVFAAGGRAGTVGFVAGVSPSRYAAAQSYWILHYLRLCFWPSPLVFDYGFAVAPWDAATLFSSCVILLVLGFTCTALVYQPAIGFLFAAFFALLAPSSSFVPISTQVAAERRMYLPLAAVVILTVLLAAKLLARLPAPQSRLRGIALALLAVAALPLAVLTVLRNEDYRTPGAMWADTIEKAPNNPRAYTNFGQLLVENGRPAEGIPYLRRAIELDPLYIAPRCILGVALIRSGHTPEAVQAFREALAVDPDDPTAYINLAAALEANREHGEAVVWYRKTVERQPNNAEANFHLGLCLKAIGSQQEAEASFKRARELDPRLSARISMLRGE